jgi:hypothetical protein
MPNIFTLDARNLMIDEAAEPHGDEATELPQAPESVAEEATPAESALQAQLAEAQRKLEEFGKDNAKYRKRIREMKAEAVPETPQEPQVDHASEALARIAAAQAIRAEALKQGMDPDFVEDAEKFVDLGDIEVDVDSGRVEGVADAVSRVLTERPKLKKQATRPGVATAAPGSNVKSRNPLDVKPGEISAMSPEEFAEFADAVGVVETQDNPSAPVIRWNLSSSPNQAHKRIRDAQASNLTDRIAGGGFRRK